MRDGRTASGVRPVSGARLGEALGFIERFYDEHTYMPTAAQVGVELGCGTSHASQVIRALWREGNLSRIRVSESRWIYVLPRQMRSR